MPPPNLRHIRYTLPKVAILRSLATIPLFRRFPPKPYSAPTLENNNLSVGPPKPGNLPSTAQLCGSMLSKSWLKCTSIGRSIIKYVVKSENPSGSPSLVYSTMEKKFLGSNRLRRIIALVILIILTPNILILTTRSTHRMPNK
jgi:hypothetical protein